MKNSDSIDVLHPRGLFFLAGLLNFDMGIMFVKRYILGKLAPLTPQQEQNGEQFLKLLKAAVDQISKEEWDKIHSIAGWTTDYTPIFQDVNLNHPSDPLVPLLQTWSKEMSGFKPGS
mgnify:CR=1 FL=1